MIIISGLLTCTLAFAKAPYNKTFPEVLSEFSTSDQLLNVGKGFAGLARMTQCNILPVGIIGTEEKRWIPFTGKIIIKIGEMIPYSENVDEMVAKWVESIQELTGFKYLAEAAV